MREFFSNRNNQPIFYTFGAYLVLTIGSFLINRQAESALSMVKNLLPFCALIATLITVWIRFISRQVESSLDIWDRIILGTALWMVAEFIWMTYFTRGAGSGPFLGLADVFWLAGCVPLIEAMSLRYQSFRTRPGKSRVLNVMFFLLALLIPIAYILTIPTVLGWKNWDQTLILFTQIGYILANLTLIAFAILILLTVGRGNLFRIWGLMAIAFILRALTYFLITYLPTSLGLTERLAILPSLLLGLAYLILGTGIYGNWLIGKQIALVSQLKLGFIGQEKEIPQFLINTDVEGKIVNISHNFLQFTNNSLPERYLGKPIQDALNLSSAEFREIAGTCERGGFIVNFDIKVAAGQKAPVPLLLTAVGSLTVHDYFGLDIALQLPYYSAQAYPLDAESNVIVQEILRRTGQQTQKSSSLLAEYFMTHIQSFYEMVNRSTGRYTVASMSNEINTTAAKNNWPIRVNGQEVTIEPGFSDFDNSALLKSLPVLFQIARRYTIEATSAREVDEQTEKIDHELSKPVLQNAKQFGLR